MRKENDDSRETQLGYDTRLVKGQPGRADCVESPNPEEEPKSVVFEGILELLPIKVFVRRFRRVDRKSALDKRLLAFGKPLHCRRD